MRLLEIHIEAADLERSVDFYRRLLPHRKIIRTDDGSQVFLVLRDGTSFGIWKAGTDGIMGGRGAAHLHYALQIAPSEYDDFKARLQELSTEPLEHTWPEGSRSIYFFDPDGHQGEFMTRDWLDRRDTHSPDA